MIQQRKIYVIHRQSVIEDKGVQKIPWGNHIAALHYPTWHDLHGAKVTAIQRLHNWSGIEVWDVRCNTHGFVFSINSRYLREPDDTCVCDMQVLMCRGCQCGGS